MNLIDNQLVAKLKAVYDKFDTTKDGLSGELVESALLYMSRSLEAPQVCYYRFYCYYWYYLYCLLFSVMLCIILFYFILFIYSFIYYLSSFIHRFLNGSES